MPDRALPPPLPPLPRLEILALEPASEDDLLAAGARSIGASREGRDILAIRLGTGPLRISLIGGCHADEPVGPETLNRLAAFLLESPAASPFLAGATWSLVPHVNPDGRLRNRGWSDRRLEVVPPGRGSDSAFDLVDYLSGCVREAPGDDIEFGFPENENGGDVRPENRAVAEFLRTGAPFDLHASFHGMGIATGVWFLLEPGWIDRTAALRDNVRRRVRALGHPLLDIDRKGEKGFTRIDEGFSTRPDSKAMASFFLARDEPATAKLFRPNSMEYVRSLGGDPLTIVPEVPLFLLPEREPATEARERLTEAAATGGRASVEGLAFELGIRPLPIRDQTDLQLAFLAEAVRAITPS